MLKLAWNAYRHRYGLDAPTAYRLARWCCLHRGRIHDTWLRYNRGEIPLRPLICAKL